MTQKTYKQELKAIRYKHALPAPTLPALLAKMQKIFTGLRLGQLICNAIEDGADGMVDEAYIYHITDHELRERLKAYIKKHFSKGFSRVPERR